MKILLTGGTGLLGQEVRKLDSINVVAPTHEEMDIVDFDQVYQVFQEHKPDLVIHAAAITDNRLVERNPSDAMMANILGTCVIARMCSVFDVRLVYISTDYVYKGDRGNYRESDELLPFNMYAWLKLGGECAVRSVKNHLIVRTTFGPNQFPYEVAFVDKYTSKDYVDVIAPKILDAAVSPLTGVVNIGTDRKSIMTHAFMRTPSVIPVKLRNSPHRSPVDSSMNLQRWQDYKAENPVLKRHDTCRACGNTNLIKYLDLGIMPLANNLEATAQRARDVERYPLQVLRCPVCGLSQLSVVVNPEVMFHHYVYRSGINGGYIQHCREMGVTFGEQAKGLHVDIAGNDGTLLKAFPYNTRKLNVDPAVNLCAIARREGIESLARYWNAKTAEDILATHGQASLITATNVFAHVDDINGFLIGVKLLLAPTGICVLEFPYVLDYVERMAFDTVYFEHLSYMGLEPIRLLCQALNLEITNIAFQEIHGGTMRVEITHKGYRAPTVQVLTAYVWEKEHTLSKDWYEDWETRVAEFRDVFGKQMLEIKQTGHKVAAFAASAKGNTLLNTCGINTDIIDYIVDETPEKVGKFSPGTGIPIVGPDVLMNHPPDFLLVMSWNFAEEIMTRCKNFGFTGKFIIPLPTFRVI